MIVEGGAFVEQVIGANDGGIAARVAAADPSFLEHRNVGQAVFLRQVIRRPQSMSAAAHDDGVVGGLGLGLAPLLLPPEVAGQSAPDQRQRRECLSAHEWRAGRQARRSLLSGSYGESTRIVARLRSPKISICNSPPTFANSGFT